MAARTHQSNWAAHAQAAPVLALDLWSVRKDRSSAPTGRSRYAGAWALLRIDWLAAVIQSAGAVGGLASRAGSQAAKFGKGVLHGVSR